MGEKFKFEKLTPVRDADISVYKEAFDFILILFSKMKT